LVKQKVPTNLAMTLPEYITRLLREPFCWGKHDCVLFAVGWLNIRSDKNWLDEFGTWQNAKEAMRIVKNLGGLEHACNVRLTKISPNMAQDGDIALYRRCLCLFSGSNIVGPNKNGLEFIDRTQAESAWSVKCLK
jgi:hypothetical protein